MTNNCLYNCKSIVVVNAYTGVLTAFLTVPKLKPTISTVEELAENKDGLSLVIEPETDLSYKFTVSHAKI